MRGPSCATWLAVVLLGVVSTPARADPRYRVVLLQPSDSDEVTSDATARVRGELTAANFEVTVVPQDPALDVRRALETVGRELGPIATFAILRAPGATTAEIWVCDRLAGKSVIQTVRLDRAGEPHESPSLVLAVEAVELLKASLAQHWLGSARPATPPPRTPERLDPPVSQARSELAVEAAVGWLDSAGAVPGAWQPIVRAGWGAYRWAGRVTVGGLGTDAELRASSGSARIRQELAVLEIVRSFRARGRLRPFVAAGAGVLRARVEGSGAAPYTGVTTTSWSGLATAGGGIAVGLVPHVALALEGQVMLACPYTRVRFPTVESANVAWPALLLTAGLRAGF